MKTPAHHVLIGMLCLGAGNSHHAAAQGKLSQRYPLSADAISRALHRDGLDVRAEDVHMPMPLSTAVSDPLLEIVGMDRLPDGHLRLRLRCQHAGECLPFGVTLMHDVVVPMLLVSAQPPAASAGVGSSMAPTLPQPVGTPVFGPEAAVVVRAGTRLTLLLEEGHMHIHLPVVALDSATGDGNIRVATPDHKHTYRATVVDATTVRGIME